MQKHNRTITAKDREAAARLSALWADYKKKNPGVSQETAGAKLKYSQAVFSQYLHCKIALGTDAVRKFAGLFGVDPGAIRPELAGTPPHRATVLAAAEESPAYGLDPEALEIARAWSALPAARRQCIKESIFLEAAVSTLYPWLSVGRPATRSYEEFERRVEKGIQSHGRRSATKA